MEMSSKVCLIRIDLQNERGKKKAIRKSDNHFLSIRSTYREVASKNMFGNSKLFLVQALLQGVDSFHIGSNGLFFSAESACLKALFLRQTRWKLPAFFLRDPLLQVGC